MLILHLRHKIRVLGNGCLFPDSLSGGKDITETSRRMSLRLSWIASNADLYYDGPGSEGDRESQHPRNFAICFILRACQENKLGHSGLCNAPWNAE